MAQDDPREITLATGTPAYARVPAGAGRGLVVVHESHGRSPQLEAVVDRLAGHGFAAVLPDLFAGGGRFCLVRLLRESRTGRGRSYDILRAARRWLLAEGVPQGRVGLIGFCMGGGFALAAGPGWAAVSANYGVVPHPDALAHGGPLLACYGGRDRFIGPRHHERLTRALAEVGREGEVLVFPEAGHSFLTECPEPTRFQRIFHIGHHPTEAARAWPRILAFFDHHLPAQA